MKVRVLGGISWRSKWERARGTKQKLGFHRLGIDSVLGLIMYRPKESEEGLEKLGINV